MAKVGVYPGTFDPMTIGHLDIIRRALTAVDHLIIGVAGHSGKNPIFSLSERAEIAQQSIKTLEKGEGERVTIVPFETLLVDFVRTQKAHLIIRGLRAISDFECEFQMAAMNKKMNGEVETLFLMASDSCQFIASRFIKEVARLGGNVSPFVTPFAAQKIKEKLKAGAL